MITKIKNTIITQRLDSKIVMDKDYFCDWEDKAEEWSQGTV